MMRKFLLALGLLLALPLAAQAANCGVSGGNDCYWIGGTGNFSDSTHWSLTSGGLTCVCTPTISNHLNFDSNSGTGTATEDGTGAVSFGRITASGTNAVSVDFSAHNNNVTINDFAFATGISWHTGTGSINFGSGTWTCSGAQSGGICFNITPSIATTSNMTLAITLTAFDSIGIASGNTFSAVSITGVAGLYFSFCSSGVVGTNIGTLTIAAPAIIGLGCNGIGSTVTTLTVSGGSQSNKVLWQGDASANLTFTNAPTVDWVSFVRQRIVGSITANDCNDFGGNTATGTFTCNPPSGGGGGAPASFMGSAM